MGVSGEMVILDVMNNVEATKDDGVTDASIVALYGHGRELLKTLFFDEDYDVVIAVEESSETSSENILQTTNQKQPIRYLQRVPVTVYTTDKEEHDVVVVTGRTMQSKVRASVREEVEEFSLGEAHTIMIRPRTDPQFTRALGFPLWSREYSVEYREYESR